jgi:hypothetical protein
MKSATSKSLLRAVLLSVTLLTVGTTAAYADGPAAPELAAKVVGQPAKAPQARTMEPGDAESDLPPALSTLAAIALGIIGLLWVRRYTAER